MNVATCQIFNFLTYFSKSYNVVILYQNSVEVQILCQIAFFVNYREILHQRVYEDDQFLPLIFLLATPSANLCRTKEHYRKSLEMDVGCVLVNFCHSIVHKKS